MCACFCFNVFVRARVREYVHVCLYTRAHVGACMYTLAHPRALTSRAVGRDGEKDKIKREREREREREHYFLQRPQTQHPQSSLHTHHDRRQQDRAGHCPLPGKQWSNGAHTTTAIPPPASTQDRCHPHHHHRPSSPRSPRSARRQGTVIRC